LFRCQAGIFRSIVRICFLEAGEDADDLFHDPIVTPCRQTAAGALTFRRSARLRDQM
jgi:hypothetical protein